MVYCISGYFNYSSAYIETIADNVLVIKEGTLVADDSPEQLVNSVNGKNLEDVYMRYFDA